jgi:hypothetical protein
MRSLVRGRVEDELDPCELAAAQLDTMEALAQDCVELSSTLMTSLADILMRQKSNAERLPLLPHGSPTRVPYVSVRLFEEVSTPATAPPATRRRLCGKQCSASSCNSPVSTIDSCSPFSQISLTQRMGGGKKLGRRLYEILRRFHQNQWEATVGQCFEPPPGNSMSIAKRDAQRAAFSKLTKKARLQMARQVVASEDMPADLLPYLRSRESKVSKTVSQQRIQRKCVCLTFNGEWGFIPMDVPTDYSSEQGLRNLRDRMRDHSDCVKLWRRLQLWAADVQKRFSLFRMSHCIELSIQTLAEGIVRVHVHVCLEREPKLNVLANDAALQFLGSAPFFKMDDMFTRSQRSGHRPNTNQAHSYIQGPKTSKIFASGKPIPFLDDSAKSEWVSNRIQDGQFALEACREEFVKCGRYLRENLAILDLVQQERSHMAPKEHILGVQRRLRRSRMPVHTYEQVVNFNAQFETEKNKRPILVINGPRGLGKTTFVRSLCEPQEILELSCEGMAEPDLREVKFNQTRVVLLNECSAKLILSYKKVFMGSPASVTLGSSKWGCYSYKVWTHGVKFVVCTNRWTEDLEALPPSDQQWLQRNTILLQVDACMYVDS